MVHHSSVRQGAGKGEGSLFQNKVIDCVTSKDGHAIGFPTPVRADRLNVLLAAYNPVTRHELVTGFTSGFDIGFRGVVNSDLLVSSLRSTDDKKLTVDQALAKEVSLGRMDGPFPRPPFQSFQLNPIGLVPKKEAATRSKSPGGNVNPSGDIWCQSVTLVAIRKLDFCQLQ